MVGGNVLIFVVFKGVTQLSGWWAKRCIDGYTSNRDDKDGDGNAKNCCGFHDSDKL